MSKSATDPPAELASLALVRTPKTAIRMTGAMLVGLAALPVGLTQVPWVQTVHGGGRAIAFDPVQRPQFLASPIEGRVMKWYVVEGQRVAKGQRIVELVDNDPERLNRLKAEEKAIADRVTAATARITNIESQIASQTASMRSGLIMAESVKQENEARLRVAEDLLRESEADLVAADQNHARQVELYNNGLGKLASLRDVELAKQGLDRTKARVSALKGQIKQATASLAVATENIANVKAVNEAMIKSQEATKNSAESELASAKQAFQQIQSQVKRQEAQYIDAPTDGVIWQLLANAEAGGILVRPGDRLARLVPDIKPRAKPDQAVLDGLAAVIPVAPTAENWEYPGIVVEVGIDGNDLPLVREGDKVRLQFEGWPAVQFAGWPSVAVGTFGGRVYLVDPTANDSGRFRILVEPDPAERPWPAQDYLRQGVRAQGWVLLQEVSAGWEIWRQINGFPPTREPKEKVAVRPLGPIGK